MVRRKKKIFEWMDLGKMVDFFYMALSNDIIHNGHCSGFWGSHVEVLIFGQTSIVVVNVN